MITIIFSAILISILFAPLGCLLLWQRQSYFADGLAHSCLFASTITISLGLPILITAPFTAIIFVFLLFLTQKQNKNAAINLVSSFMLASGILIASTFPNRINLHALLLGDILSTSSTDLMIFALLIIIMAIILWKKLDDIILLSLNSTLASAQGINTRFLETTMLIILAIMLTVTMKIIGSLLAVAMLILPGFTASIISKNPLQMLFYSIYIAIIVNICGVIFSFYLDLPTGPSIIFTYGIAHSFILLYKKILHRS